ncbi:MAG TPA: 3-dehydroquinate synthase, partial [Fusobacteriaceae bacterium]|nr:3-dehydroquinate synthase [Fusobacteriaceae bacterium]
KYYNYTKYTHGEAISIGMYEITRLGERLNITKLGESEKIKEILQNYNLPIEDEVKLKDLVEIMKTDKKNISGILNFIFLSEVGSVEIKKISEKEITEKLLK